MVEIHNGQVVGEPLAQDEPLPAKPADYDLGLDLDPEHIARLMASTISLKQLERATPMEIVNALLQLKSASGAKMVWTRFDLFQIFALQSKKLVGELKA